MPMPARVSLVMEYENATVIADGAADGVFGRLAEELTRQPKGRVAELILVHRTSDITASALEQLVRRSAPELERSLELRCVGREGLRYYEMKNAGVREATGDVVVFLDSDSIPEPGWLEALLAPLDDPRVIATSGHTYLAARDFYSRTMALIWFFPLRTGDERRQRRRSLNANNSAFRRDWIRAHPFPDNPGFKVSCSLLFAELERSGNPVVRAPAFTQHEPLPGGRFFFWRAAVAGRDADRRFEVLRSPRRLSRLRSATGRFLHALVWVPSRILFQGHQVQLPLWQAPAAIGVGWTYHTLLFLNQAARAAGLLGEQVEHIPAYVEGH